LKASAQIPVWTIAAPVFAGAVLLAAGFGLAFGGITVGLIALGLAGSVFAAVHHAEVIAHRVGEPFGSKSSLLLMLSLFVVVLVLRTGRTIILHGIILLTVFLVYLFTTVVP
jgi:Ca2+:H+ antiporter